MRVLTRMGITASTPLCVLALSLTICAQGDPGGGKPPATPAGGGRTPAPKVIVRTHDRIVLVTPKTGTLTIIAEPGATIRLQSLKGSEVSEESTDTIPSGERSIIFNKLQPGHYRVIAELSGFKSDQGEIRVVPNKADKVDLNLVPITYNVTVKLNAPSGTLRYAKGGEVSRSVTFQNNQANLSGLTSGDYTVKIIPDDPSYIPKDTNLRVSSDNQVSFDLDHLESRAFLGATASAWSLPSGWSFSSGKVIVRGSGMALPSDVSYSHYTNFQLSTQVRMVNGIAASFAVHVVNPQNYYLVQITGPNADEPYVLRGFIVKNGVAQRFGNPTPISQFSDTLQPGKFFQVVLTMVDGDITVRVEDSATGDRPKLGILSDPSRTFRIGAVGIASREGEQNEFSAFTICVSGCPNP